MGREPFPWFSFKSKAQREKEQQRYGAWAFPYGAAQQERIRALLGELFPREEPSLAMVRYLNRREGYWDYYGEGDEGRDPLADALAAMVRRSNRRPTEELLLYAALIQADAQVGPELDYPTAEELRALAAALR